jgi:hypothetical protein
MKEAKKHFEKGGERMRFTYPSLITATIRLARKYKLREKEVSGSCDLVAIALTVENRKKIGKHES